MGESADIRMIDSREVIRDLINWMDCTDAKWRSLEAVARRDLLSRAHLYFEQVARAVRGPLADRAESLQRRQVVIASGVLGCACH
jgi:hypothetical protein